MAGKFNSIPKFSIHRARYAVSRVALLRCDASCFVNLPTRNRYTCAEQRTALKLETSFRLRGRCVKTFLTSEKGITGSSRIDELPSSAKTDLAFNGATLLNPLSHPIFSVCVTEWLPPQTHFDSKLRGILTRPIPSCTYTNDRGSPCAHQYVRTSHVLPQSRRGFR